MNRPAAQALRLAPAPRPRRIRRPLGDILVETGALSPADLTKALALQARQNLRLGDILLAHGMVGEADLTRALAEQYDALTRRSGGAAADPR
ncbi:hypothetical protein JT55_12750 [Rhodovulum sp. NI22]|nr:hypothetical protein JT55_12750 [Rhodovulum sp. NI22]